MVKKATKSFGEVMPKIEFYPELPKLRLNEVLNKEYEITDAQIVRDFDSKFGTSDFALILLTDLENGEQYTTLCGGIVVVKKVQFALDNKLFPLLGTINQDKDYYDII